MNDRMMNTYKISLKEKIGYGFGDAAASMFWKLFTMYLMFFYTDVFGISAVVVGMLFLTLLWEYWPTALKLVGVNFVHICFG